MMASYRERLGKESLDRLDMLYWMSERNHHVPIADLAFMLDVSEDHYVDDILRATGGILDE